MALVSATLFDLFRPFLRPKGAGGSVEEAGKGNWRLEELFTVLLQPLFRPKATSQ